jgi:hypothetical protein
VKKSLARGGVAATIDSAGLGISGRLTATARRRGKSAPTLAATPRERTLRREIEGIAHLQRKRSDHYFIKPPTPSEYFPADRLDCHPADRGVQARALTAVVVIVIVIVAAAAVVIIVIIVVTLLSGCNYRFHFGSILQVQISVALLTRGCCFLARFD